VVVLVLDCFPDQQTEDDDDEHDCGGEPPYGELRPT
jgi:hypothetical protein